MEDESWRSRAYPHLLQEPAGTCRNLQEPLYPDVLCVLLMVLLLISIDVILHLQENSSDRKLLLEEYATKTELEDLKANMSCKNTFLLSIFIKSRFYRSHLL